MLPLARLTHVAFYRAKITEKPTISRAKFREGKSTKVIVAIASCMVLEIGHDGLENGGSGRAMKSVACGLHAIVCRCGDFKLLTSGTLHRGLPAANTIEYLVAQKNLHTGVVLCGGPCPQPSTAQLVH